MNWLRQFAHWHRRPWPDDYLVFDIETTGLRRDEDLPVDFGWCLVRDREVCNHGNFVLDWTRYPQLVEPAWLGERLEQVREKMAQRGDEWVYSPGYLREKGTDPLAVLGFAHRLFYSNRRSGASFVGHNAWAFDCPILETVFLEYLGGRKDVEPFVFQGDEVYDTGGIEKGSQLGLYPFPEETLRTYFLRVHKQWAPGVKWSLSHCVAKYRLADRLPADGGLHQAGTDVMMTHLLFEELKQWAGSART